MPSTTKPLIISINQQNINLIASLDFNNNSIITSNNNNKINNEDLFDKLDKERIPITIDNLIEEEEVIELKLKEDIKIFHNNSTALIDKSNTLFPSLNKLELNKELNSQNWLKETSGKVIKLIGTKLFLPLEIKGELAESNNLILDESNKKSITETTIKIVAGCEDGSIWLFSPSSTITTITNSNLKTTNNSSKKTTTEISTEPNSPPTAPFSSYNISAQLTPSTSSPSTSKEFSLTSSTSSSNSPPPSPTSASRSRSSRPTTTGTIPHLRIRPTSPSGSTLSSRPSDYSYPSSLSLNANGSNNLEPPIQPLRPRKASATVSVSTTGGGGAGDDPTDISSFGVSSLPSSPTLPSAPTFGVSHSSSSSILGVGGGIKKGNHKARKTSITAGIGLWETESHSRSSEELVNILPELLEGVDLNLEEEEKEEEDMKFDSLVPCMNVVVGGEGAIVDLKILEGTRFGSSTEGGKAFILLRSSGLLSIHSLIDGRALGSLDLSPKVTSSRNGVIEFKGLEIIDTNSGKIVICHGKNNQGIISIDLNSLEVLETIETIESIAGFSSFTSSEGLSSLAYISLKDDAPHIIYRKLNSTSNSSPESLAVNSSETKSTTIRIGENEDAGVLPGMSKDIRGIRRCGGNIIAFDKDGLLLFTIRDNLVVSLGYLGIEGVVDVCVENDKNLIVSTGKGQSHYRLESTEADDIHHFVHVRTFKVKDIEASTFLTLTPSSSHYLFARSTSSRRHLESVLLASNTGDSSDVEEPIKSLYGVSRSSKDSKIQINAIVSIDTENAVIGLNSGLIYEAPYSNLYDLTTSKSKVQLGGPISLLEIIEMGSRKVVVAGSSNGEAGAWYLPDWELIQIWKLFASPVTHLVQFKVKSSITSRLTNSLALISANSPVAIVSLFPPALLFVIPGTKSSVETLSSNGEDLMVIYKHGLVRVWDVELQELRRSMDLKTALGVLAEKGWKTWFSLNDRLAFEKNSSSPYNPALTVDLRLTIDNVSKSLPWVEKKRSKSEISKDNYDLEADTNNSRDHLNVVKYLLSNLLTFDLDTECDITLKEHLGIEKPRIVSTSAVLSTSSLSFPVTSNPWAVSGVATAQRLLHIVCLLRVFLNFPDTERHASEAIVFYASFLSNAVGSSFIAPALDVFADYWLDVSTEVQQAARLLFGTYLVSSSDGYMLSLVERWQGLLPSRQVESTFCESADQAVLVIGLLAAEKFKLLSTTTLKDVSVSILSYLEKDDHPYHQAIATELCTRGFEIWQNYVDAMKLVRLLFGLATGRNANTPLEVRNLAKLATLHIAAVNTPLFMTTLSFDILNSESAFHRKATLKLLGFMVRKKPLVLYTSLPKLAEAVVKSLDPSVTSLRETVHEAATVILNELVRTYPSIDFHHSSQRLAVGTPEGATIIYDLRTGTRLYVLEGHSKSITALSWSPDGRRLVSVSLEESKVLVWKIGVGLLSMFAGGLGVGGEGRGVDGKVPWKVLDFNVGDEGLMTTAATLEWVTFEWPAERTTRLRIRESNLTFSV